VCVDLLNSDADCGKCGITCQAGQTCVMGKCE
jgi:hypothetical protein